MKYILYSLIFFLFITSFYGCGVSKKEQERLDSLRNDSIAKAKAIEDSLSLIAWGKAKFGMSEEEIDSTKMFGNEHFFGYASDDYVWSVRRAYNLDALNGINFGFEEDELQYVILESSRRSIREFSYLVNDCKIFISEFTRKYGAPTYVKEDISPIELFADSEDVAIFKIGSKTIRIYLFENSLEYGYKVHISNSAFPKKKHVPTEEELQEEKEKEAEKEQTLENSL